MNEFSTRPFAAEYPDTKPNNEHQPNDRMTIDNDHELIFGTNSETDLDEVRILHTQTYDHDNKMRNLCIDMIFEADRECLLLDAVYSAADVLGTPQHVLNSIVRWAGFEPDDECLKS